MPPHSPGESARTVRPKPPRGNKSDRASLALDLCGAAKAALPPDGGPMSRGVCRLGRAHPKRAVSSVDAPLRESSTAEQCDSPKNPDAGAPRLRTGTGFLGRAPTHDQPRRRTHAHVSDQTTNQRRSQTGTTEPEPRNVCRHRQRPEDGAAPPLSRHPHGRSVRR